MKRYRLEAKFEAEDLDDALAKLAAHFACISALGGAAPTIFGAPSEFELGFDEPPEETNSKV